MEVVTLEEGVARSTCMHDDDVNMKNVLPYKWRYALWNGRGSSGKGKVISASPCHAAALEDWAVWRL
eukprot:353000-Chlamydomonas_euryale.AAC.30